MRTIRGLLALVACCAPITLSFAQETEDWERRVDSVKIISLGQAISPLDLTSIAQLFAKAASLPESLKINCEIGGESDVACFPSLGAFALEINEDTARRAAGELRPILTKDKKPANLAIYTNELVRGYVDQCDEETTGPYPAGEVVPPNISNLRGPIPPDDSSISQRKVWVVDTGIASHFDIGGSGPQELNVARCANPASCANTDLPRLCRLNQQGAPVCRPNKADNDRFGHGTMIAGIIGADQDNTPGIVGMAPGVRLIPIQVFRRRPLTDLTIILTALEYVQSRAAVGDVVNVSWGGDWNPTITGDPSTGTLTYSGTRLVENKLRAMAASGLRVAIAAGNKSQLSNRSGYVQIASPGRSGDLGVSVMGSQPMIVSAAGVYNAATSTWTDIFWSDSVFGNSPPNFAAPGDSVTSLWNAPNTLNTCSGTSFSVAHVSGILVKGIPTTDSSRLSIGDPSGTPDPMALVPQ